MLPTRYQAQVNEYKFEIERLQRELQEVGLSATLLLCRVHAVLVLAVVAFSFDGFFRYLTPVNV
jgi:hypothetical protein